MKKIRKEFAHQYLNPNLDIKYEKYRLKITYYNEKEE